MKEALSSKRVKVIDSQTQDLHNEVSVLYESLMDGEYKASLYSVERIRLMLNLVKNQIINGHIIKIT